MAGGEDLAADGKGPPPAHARDFLLTGETRALADGDLDDGRAEAGGADLRLDGPAGGPLAEAEGVKKLAADEAERAEVGEKAAGEEAAPCAENAVGEDVLEVHQPPVFAEAGAAAEHHVGSAGTGGEEGGEVAGVVGAVGGEEDVAIDGRVLALEQIDGRLAAVAVAAGGGLGGEGTVGAGDFRGAVGGAVDADGEEVAVAGEGGAQFGEHGSEAGLLVAGRDDDGETR